MQGQKALYLRGEPLSAAGHRHKIRVARLGCVICRRLYRTPYSQLDFECEIHYVAETSGMRSDFAIVPLCHEHHTGNMGFHTIGAREFCTAFRIFCGSELGLLEIVNEQLARARL